MTGSWIRPVSKRANGELADSDCRYSNGKQPELLDIMLVPFEKPAPDQYQTENHLIDENSKWQFVRKAT